VNTAIDPAAKAAPARRSAAPSSPAPAASRGGAVLALQARALSLESFLAAAIAVVNELAQQLGCERVSIGFQAHGRVAVAAISNQTDFRAQQDVVQAIAGAMEESLEQRVSVVYPMPPGSAGGASLAHAQLAKLNGHTAIATMPFASRSRTLGALVCERRNGFDARALELAKDAAMFVAPILELKHRLEAPLASRLAEAVVPRSRRPGRWAASPWAVAAAVGALAALLMTLWPATFRVVAPGRIEGAAQRVLASPVDGFIREVAVRPGDAVRAEQLVIALEDQDLKLEREKWSVEAAQLDKQYRDALTKEDAAQIVMARSKLEQAQVQFALASRQFERAQLRAPFDGVVLSGDWAQAIGSPVKRGQELMAIAPQRELRVIAEVDEQDVALVRVGQSSRVLFAGLTSKPVDFRVTRVAPVATALEGRNVFEVEGRLDAGDANLRAGLRGVVKIDIERRSIGAQVWHATSNWLRRAWWQVVA
jgi:multidrug resistance efflux pump